MDYRVTWTPQAKADLKSIGDYIARDSKVYASNFVKKLRQAARALRYFPKRGRVVPEYEDPEVRQILLRKYRIIYRVKESSVEIVRIIHGARDLKTAMESQ